MMGQTLIFRMMFRGRSSGAATSKMERFVITIKGFQPLTIITKCAILNIAAVLDPPLILISKDSCLEMQLLCKIANNMVVVHLLSYKRRLLYYTFVNAFLLKTLKLVHHRVFYMSLVQHQLLQCKLYIEPFQFYFQFFFFSGLSYKISPQSR